MKIILAWCRLILAGLILLGFGTNSHGQVQLSGALNTSLDFYGIDADSTVRAKRDPFLYRINLSLNLKITDNISLPFSLAFRKKNSRISYPLPPNKEFFKNLSSPNNGIGFSPKFNWIQFFAGSHSPKLSDLTLGNVSIFGAGIALDPGAFRFSIHTGILNYGVEADGIVNDFSIFRRKAHAAKLGVGDKEKTHFHLNAAYFTDVENSIDTANLLRTISPAQNLVVGSDFKINLKDRFHIGAEVAASIFTEDSFNDLTARLDAPGISFANNFLTLNATSRMDYAAKASTGWTGKNITLIINGDYTGAGFESLGFPFLQEDLIKVSFSPSFKLFKNKVLIGGTYGYRFDNLSETKIATTASQILAANASITFSKAISLSTSYANFGLENDSQQDTFRIKNFSENINISPRFSFGSKEAKQNLIFIAQKSQFEDLNFIDGTIRTNDAQNLSTHYSLHTKKYHINLGGSYLYNISSFNQLKMLTATAGIGTNILKKKMRVRCSYIFQHSDINPTLQRIRNTIKAQLNYKFDKKTKLSASGRFNIYNSANDTRFNYTETLSRITFQRKF